MMEEKDILSEKESLDLIVRMIGNSRSNFYRGTGYHFLLWGYLVCIAGAVQFVFYMHPYGSIGWLLLLPVGIPLSYCIYRRFTKQAKVYTYTDRIVSAVWVAYGISTLIACLIAYGVVAVPKGAFFLFYPCLLLLAGIAVFITGIAYRYKLLMYSAGLCWAGMVASMLIGSYRISLLIYVVAFFLSCLLPGHLLIRKAKQDV